MHLEQLGRLDLVQPKPPAVHLAKVDLLAILVVAIRGEQRLARAVVLVEIAPLRKRRAVQKTLALATVPPQGRGVRARPFEQAAQLIVIPEHASQAGGSAEAASLEQMLKEPAGRRTVWHALLRM